MQNIHLESEAKCREYLAYIFRQSGLDSFIPLTYNSSYENVLMLIQQYGDNKNKTEIESTRDRLYDLKILFKDTRNTHYIRQEVNKIQENYQAKAWSS